MKTFRLLSFVLVVMLALLAISSPVAADRLPNSPHGGRPLSATLTGPVEVPPGDPDGSGSARFTLNQGQGEICFEITVEDITLPATAAHIHKAPAGVPGPIVVPLTAPDESGFSSGCVTGVDRELIRDIRQHPEAYYVNVHNAAYPGGAVRGQLSKP